MTLMKKHFVGIPFIELQSVVSLDCDFHFVSSQKDESDIKTSNAHCVTAEKETWNEKSLEVSSQGPGVPRSKLTFCVPLFGDGFL